MVVDAKGKDKRGNGTAGAVVVMTMTERAGTSTDVEVLTDLAITGKPAQFGRGVMQDVSDKLLGQFVACLGAAVRQPGSGGRDRRRTRPRRRAEPEPEPHADRRGRSGGGRGPTARPGRAAASPPRAAPAADAQEGRRRPGPRRHGAADPGQVLLEAGARRARRASALVIWLIAAPLTARCETSGSSSRRPPCGRRGGGPAASQEGVWTTCGEVRPGEAILALGCAP